MESNAILAVFGAKLRKAPKIEAAEGLCVSMRLTKRRGSLTFSS
jgi:hypothetical protein